MKFIPTLLLIITTILLAANSTNMALQAQDKEKKPSDNKEQEKKDEDNTNKKSSKDDDKKKSGKNKEGNNKKKGSGKKKKKRSPLTVANHLARLSKIKLTDDQKNKLEPISKEYTRKYTLARDKFDLAIDEKTRKARAVANEKFHTKGYRGDKLRNAIDKAVDLSRVQKAAVEIFRKAKQELDSDLRKVLWAALSPKERQIVGLPEQLPEESP